VKERDSPNPLPSSNPLGVKKKYEISKPVVLWSHICSYDMSGSQKLELYWFCSTMDMFPKNDEKRQSSTIEKKRRYNSSGLCPIRVPFGSQNITIEKTLTVTRIPYYVCKIT
jgi:hypothetical protein